MKPLIDLTKTICRPAIDYALPPRCCGCGAIVAADLSFCTTCWETLRFIGPPWCAACQLPFEHDMGEGALCAGCIAEPPGVDGIYCAIGYGDVARRVVLRLKYGRRIGFAKLAAGQLGRHLPDDASARTFIPVPLHRMRLWSRGFNQALEIARPLARASGATLALDWIVRTRHTPPLKGLGRKQRRATVKGVFAVRKTARAAIKGADIVIVDDVHTSGATTGELARVLKRCGAASVVVMCWARVLDATGQGGDPRAR